MFSFVLVCLLILFFISKPAKGQKHAVGQATMTPSQLPTAASKQADTQLSDETSSAASSYPSNQPSGIPSSRPSSQPSSQPSSYPSSQPTLSPTAPTFRPTKPPSFSPTIKNYDMVKVSGISRVKFINGQTLNDLSLATLVSAFQNISDNAQSTVITSTVLVAQSSPQLVRRGRTVSMLESGQAIPNQISSTYDISFLFTYLMTYHPGYPSSQLATLKTTTIRQVIEVGQFESTLRYWAQAQNATQLLKVSCREVISLHSIVVPSSSSSSSSSNNDDSLPTDKVAGIVIGILGGCLVLGVVLYVILKRYDDEKKRASEEMSVEGRRSDHITELKKS